MPGLTTNKLSDSQKQQVKSLILKYDGRGWSQFMLRDKIERELGINLSQPMVGLYKKQAWQEVARDGKHNRDDARAQKIEQLRDVRREAWDAWVRSSEDTRKTVEEYCTEKEQVAPDDFVTSEALVKRIETREGRLPDNAYLSTIMKTLEAERELLGLDEVQAGTVTVEQVLVVIGAIRDGIREVLADHPVLLKALLQRTAVVLPALTEQKEVV